MLIIRQKNSIALVPQQSLPFRLQRVLDEPLPRPHQIKVISMDHPDHLLPAIIAIDDQIEPQVFFP